MTEPPAAGFGDWPEGAGLVRDIGEHPEDDAPRLVYADWLDEHGEPARAEFIRVQVELARLPAGAPAPAELVDRERALREEVLRSWLGPLCGAVEVEWHFERGLPDRVTLGVETFVEVGETICRESGVREVHLFSTPRGPGERPDLGALADLPSLGRVRLLDLRGCYLGAADVEALAASPHLTGLAELRLEGNRVGAEGVRVLAGCASLGGLTALRLGGNLVGDEGVRALAGGALRRLEVLDLSHNSVTDDGLSALAGSPLLAGLRVLDLSKNVLSDAGVRALTASPHLRGLTGLDLAGNFLGDGAVLALAHCRALEGLEALDLTDNHFGPAGVGAWAGSPFIGRLLPVRFH
jgi:uncharacterized protein (TIGR02996 family)